MFPRIKKFIQDYKELKFLAYHDPLTGLLNRNWLYKNKMNIQKKYVYFVDINDLKEQNKFGHTYGDNYIKSVVNEIKNTITSNNYIFIRYAGDEFILFSDSENLLTTNELYAVGCSSINNKIDGVIILADNRMIYNKLKFKNKRK